MPTIIANASNIEEFQRKLDENVADASRAAKTISKEGEQAISDCDELIEIAEAKVESTRAMLEVAKRNLDNAIQRSSDSENPSEVPESYFEAVRVASENYSRAIELERRANALKSKLNDVIDVFKTSQTELAENLTERCVSSREYLKKYVNFIHMSIQNNGEYTSTAAGRRLHENAQSYSEQSSLNDFSGEITLSDSSVSIANAPSALAQSLLGAHCVGQLSSSAINWNQLNNALAGPMGRIYANAIIGENEETRQSLVQDICTVNDEECRFPYLKKEMDAFFKKCNEPIEIRDQMGIRAMLYQAPYSFRDLFIQSMNYVSIDHTKPYIDEKGRLQSDFCYYTCHKTDESGNPCLRHSINIDFQCDYRANELLHPGHGYGCFFHEWGHYLDSLAGDNGELITSQAKRTVYAGKVIDYTDLLKRDMQDYVISKARDAIDLYCDGLTSKEKAELQEMALGHIMHSKIENTRINGPSHLIQKAQMISEKVKDYSTQELVGFRGELSDKYASITDVFEGISNDGLELSEMGAYGHVGANPNYWFTSSGRNVYPQTEGFADFIKHTVSAPVNDNGIKLLRKATPRIYTYYEYVYELIMESILNKSNRR